MNLHARFNDYPFLVRTTILKHIFVVKYSFGDVEL